MEGRPAGARARPGRDRLRKPCCLRTLLRGATQRRMPAIFLMYGWERKNLTTCMFGLHCGRGGRPVFNYEELSAKGRQDLPKASRETGSGKFREPDFLAVRARVSFFIAVVRPPLCWSLWLHRSPGCLSFGLFLNKHVFSYAIDD